MLADARHTLRRWSRRPAFTAISLLTLALGIGATTAIFSVADAVLLRPVPWPDPDRLIAIYTVLPEQRFSRAAQATWNRSPVTWPTWQALAASPAFASVGAWTTSQYTEGSSRTELVSVAHVSSALLPMLGATPQAGRFFNAAEDQSAERIVLVSYEVWQRRFGGRPTAIGEPVELAYASPDARPVAHAIVGVLPPSFKLKEESLDFVLPIGLAPLGWRETEQLVFDVIARLAHGVSVDAAAAAAGPIVQRGFSPEQRASRVVPLADDLFGDAGHHIALLLAGAGLLLIISCANVAGLLLGDAWARRNEIAVRLALGGSGRRLLRQLTVEHLLLGGAASVAGLGLAWWLTPVFVAMAPGSLPRLDFAGLDVRVGAFAIGLGLVTSLAFGIAPALMLVSTPAAEILAAAGREGAPRGHHGQRVAVVAQLAFALVMIVGASLLGETMLRLTSQPLGFNPRNLAVVSATFMGPTVPAPVEVPPVALTQRPTPRQLAEMASRRYIEARAIRVTDVLSRLRPLPDVLTVAGVSAAPFIQLPPETEITSDDCPIGTMCRAVQVSVTGEYFQAMGAVPIRGRAFVAADDNTPAAVVSRTFEQRYLGGDALGRRFATARRPENQFEVVGVVPDVPVQEFADQQVPTFYRPGGAGVSQFMIRTSQNAAAALPMIRQAFRDYDPRYIVTATTTMEARLARSIAVERFRAALSAVFGGAALVLAAVGLYGLAARRVADRRHELGVRAAMGARPRDLSRLVIRDGVWTLTAGLMVGLPAATGASLVLRSYLFGVSPTAPHVFLIAFAALALAALGAMVIPARRAGRVDVMETLRT